MYLCAYCTGLPNASYTNLLACAEKRFFIKFIQTTFANNVPLGRLVCPDWCWVCFKSQALMVRKNLRILVYNLKKLYESRASTVDGRQLPRTQMTLKRITSSGFLWRRLGLFVSQPQPNHCYAVFYTHLLCAINSALERKQNPRASTHHLLALCGQTPTNTVLHHTDHFFFGSHFTKPSSHILFVCVAHKNKWVFLHEIQFSFLAWCVQRSHRPSTKIVSSSVMQPTLPYARCLLFKGPPSHRVIHTMAHCPVKCTVDDMEDKKSIRLHIVNEVMSSMIAAYVGDSDMLLYYTMG